MKRKTGMMNHCVHLEVCHRILPPKEEDWRLMADEDPCPDSVAGDSGHGTMTAKAETVADNEELI